MGVGCGCGRGVWAVGMAVGVGCGLWVWAEGGEDCGQTSLVSSLKWGGT